MTYDELSPDAKVTALNTATQWVSDNVYLEDVTEDFKAILRLLGYAQVHTDYSGFYSQGDGACFDGYWNAKRFDYAGLREHAPKDTELHGLSLRLLGLTLQQPDGIGRVARYSGRYSGRYSHDKTMISENIDSDDSQYDAKFEAELLDISRALARWYYAQLEAENDYQNSDEAIHERLGDTNFNAEGEII